jgi:hypothetical protein
MASKILHDEILSHICDWARAIGAAFGLPTKVYKNVYYRTPVIRNLRNCNRLFFSKMGPHSTPRRIKIVDRIQRERFVEGFQRFPRRYRDLQPSRLRTAGMRVERSPHEIADIWHIGGLHRDSSPWGRPQSVSR